MIHTIKSKQNRDCSNKLIKNNQNRLSAEMIFKSQFNQRKWFIKHQKQKYLPLNEKFLQRIRQYFNSLTSTNPNSISCEQLQDALIIFGLCQSSQDVSSLVKIIDTDSSGVIEFDEFLQIFKIVNSKRKSKQHQQKFKAFTKIVSGDLQQQISHQIDLKTSISQFRRKLILNFLKRKDKQSIYNGKRISKALAIKASRKDLLPSIQNMNN